MAKIEIAKTAMLGHGKYHEDKTLKEVLQVNRPFQVVETGNEIQAAREAKNSGAKEHSLMIRERSVDARPGEKLLKSR